LRRALNLPVLALLAAVLGWPQPRPTAPAQAVNQLDASPSLFAVLAAVNAAGYDDEIESPSNHPLRKALRDYLAGQNLASLAALKRYVRDHNPRNLSQYISFALATNGPPAFGYRYPVSALPPDVAALNEFTPLLAAFYKEANLEDLWKRSQPAFDQVIAQYTEPVSRAILQANAYLRNPTSGYLGRRFQIYVDLLGAPNQVQYRTYVDDYFVVVTPAAELPVDQIRHAYLHYLADPLTLKFAEELKTKRGLGDYALGSPILEEFYKSDFNLLATECFIKAIESRLDRKPALADQALREGFVITPAFAELLAIYEKQDQSMRLYFPDLVAGIDLRREEKRLDHIDFVSERAGRKIRVTPAEKPAELTGPAKTLEEAEKAYTDRQLDRARETYLRLIQETDEKPMHAKAYYGLARVSVLNRDPETADRLFRKVLELEPDASTKSWSLLYLARLADSQGERDEAVKSYQAALAVEDAPESVRQAATKGLREAFVGK
jgi:tetratricopeptide (TPR) repeat protein